jgi:hypothetical protein
MHNGFVLHPINLRRGDICEESTASGTRKLILCESLAVPEEWLVPKTSAVPT